MQKALLIAMAMLAPQFILAQPVTVKTQEVKEALPDNMVAPQQVYVVQNPAPVIQQPQVVAVPQNVRTQPVGIVEDTPLRESRADQLRKSRVEVEQQTETKIVERLEEERIKAEQARASKIMNSLDGKAEVAPTPAPAPQVQQSPFVYPGAMQPVQMAPAPQIVAEPAPVVAASSNSIKDDELDAPEKKKEESKFYVSGMGGYADYPGISNIKGQYAAGFSAGMLFPERFAVEGSVVFSRYKLEEVPYYFVGPVYPNIKDMEQTNISGAIKYHIIDGRIQPVVGLLAGYTKRTYRDKQWYYGYKSGDINSHAFDMGVSGGADIQLSKNFSITSDLKYMYNLSYDVESSYELSFANRTGRKSPEELEYYLFTVGGKLTF